MGGVGSGYAFSAIILERCAASIRLKTYEQERHPKLIGFVIIVDLVSAIYLGYALFTCKFY